MKKKYLRLLLTLCFVQAAQAETIVLDTVTGVHEKLTYKLFDEGKDISVTLFTTDMATIQRLLRLGTTFYFDIKGKKNKEVYVSYPVRSETAERGIKPAPGEGRPDLDGLLADLPQEGEYGHKGETELFHPMLNSLGIEIGLETTETETEGTESKGLIYRIKIPKDKIAVDDATDLSRLSIGVVSSGQKAREKADGAAGSAPSIGMGGRGRGGRGGGRGGSRGQGRQGGQRDSSNKKERPTTENIDFWFEANLKDDQ